MNTYSNSDYLRGIAENDFAILQQLYKASLPEVSQYIKRNSGTFEDAKDIFQEGILVVFKKVKQGDLVLTTSFHNYLFSVCKKLWLKKLKKVKVKEVTFEGMEEYSGIEEDVEARFVQSKKWALFQKQFQRLSEECRKVLQLLFNGQSSKAIGEVMGYTEEYAKRKKYKCKISLSKLIKADPEYQNLLQ